MGRFVKVCACAVLLGALTPPAAYAGLRLAEEAKDSSAQPAPSASPARSSAVKEGGGHTRRDLLPPSHLVGKDKAGKKAPSVPAVVQTPKPDGNFQAFLDLPKAPLGRVAFFWEFTSNPDKMMQMLSLADSFADNKGLSVLAYMSPPTQADLQAMQRAASSKPSSSAPVVNRALSGKLSILVDKDGRMAKKFKVEHFPSAVYFMPNGTIEQFSLVSNASALQSAVQRVQRAK